MKLPDHIELPEGWTYDLFLDWDSIVINRDPAKGGGMVTVDFRRRVFSPGMSFNNRAPTSTESYAGRAWQERIVNDAVKWLDAVMVQ